jgi:hypothetical protein
MAGNVSYGSLPFSEQIAFFRRKFNTKTDAGQTSTAPRMTMSLWLPGANRDALLADLRTAVEKSLDGGTLETFRKDFAAIVARYGWSYNGGFEWRSRIIYETNLRSAYMAGRYQQLMDMRDTHPYWEYVHSDVVEHPRQEHLGWNGMVLRADDPWWIYHFPINAWGCQCSVIARTEDDLKRMGKDGPDTAPPIKFIARVIGQRSPGGPRTVIVPEGIDPGLSIPRAAAGISARCRRPGAIARSATDRSRRWRKPRPHRHRCQRPVRLRCLKARPTRWMRSCSCSARPLIVMRRSATRQASASPLAATCSHRRRVRVRYR